MLKLLGDSPRSTRCWAYFSAIGFVTSNLKRADGSDWSTVFVPTTPNPTTGFLQIVPTGSLEQTGYTVEEGVKMVMSLGVLVPEES